MVAGKVVGARDIIAVFKTFRLSAANRIVRPAINKAGRRAAKIIKSKIPGRYKGVRGAIGYRPIKYRNTSKMVAGRVGAAVGNGAQKTTSKARTGRKGVGFDGRNIHWWFLGTADRMTGTKRARRGGKRGRGGHKGVEVRVDTGGVKRKTGQMPAQEEPISVLLSGSHGELRNIIRTWIAAGVKKEILRVPMKRKIK